MSKTVDQRVVEMRFDNKNFEENTKTTMSTLEKLKKSLNLEGASKGLENISAASRNVDLSGISAGIASVQSKFSALEIVGITTIANLANTAVNEGKRIAGALTIDPIKSGFQEYETQINAVQTIMANTASKGTTLNQVNAALNELNIYADKTIYNFTEMTRNIGTFTAAGVDLDKSVSAIKGIANLAAMSGSSAEQASVGMYQLSQALASGTVKLMDWNSVVNAGMGGETFQNALKQTARVHGIAVDDMIKKQGSFRESLQEGWLTADVLTETLKKFTVSGTNEYIAQNSDLTADAIQKIREESKSYDEAATAIAAKSRMNKDEIQSLITLSQTSEDAATKVKTFTQFINTLKESIQSGWTQTWQLLIGDFDQAKETFTEASNFFGAAVSNSANARNNMIQGAMFSGWDTIKQKITTAGLETDKFQNALIETAKAHGVAIDDMIAKNGSFEDSLKEGWLDGSMISETIQKFIGDASAASDTTEDLTGKLNEFQDVVNKVIKGDFGTGTARMEALSKAGYDYATIQGLVNSTLKGGATDVSAMSDAQLSNIGYTQDQIAALRDLADQAAKTGTPVNELIANMTKPSGRELMLDSIRNAAKGLIKVLTAVRGAWTDTFPPMTSTQLYGIIEGLHTFSEHLIMSDADADKLRRTMKGLFAIVDIITTITGGALKFSLKIIAKALGLVDVNALDVTASLGDAIVAFRDFLFSNNVVVKGLDKLVDGMSTAAKMIHNWIDAFLKLPIVQTNISRFGDAFGSSFKKANDYLAGGVTKIDEFIDRVKAMDSISLDDIGAIFKDFKDNVVGYFLDIKNPFTDVSKAVEAMSTDIQEQFSKTGDDVDGFKDRIINFAKDIKEKLSGFNIGSLLTIGVGAGLIATVLKVAKIIDKFTSPLEVINEAIGKIGKSVSKYIDAKAMNEKAGALLKLAIAVGILVASMVLLTTLDQSKLQSAVDVLGTLAIALMAAGVVMNGLGKIEKLADKTGGTNGALMLLAIAGSIYIIVSALKQMEGLDLETAIYNTILLGVIATGLLTLARNLSRSTTQLTKGSLLIVAIAASLKIFVSALKDMQDLKITNVEQTIGVLIGAIIMLGLVSRAASGVRIGGAVTILAIVFGLKMLVEILNDMGDLNTEKIQTNLEAFLSVFKVFAIIMLVSKVAGKNVASAGAAILTMSLSLLVVAGAVKLLGSMDTGVLIKGGIAVGIMLLIFAQVVKMSEFAGANAIKAGAMLLLMAGSLLILTVVITILGNIDITKLANAIGAIAVLSICFSMLIMATEMAQDCLPTLIVLSVALGILAIALGTLSMIDPTNLLSATAALGIVIGMFAVLVAASSLASQSFITLGVMTLTVVAIGVMLYLLAGLPVENVLGSAAAISILLLSLSASLVILSIVGAAIGPALIGILALDALILDLALVIGGLGALATQFPMIGEWVDTGIPLLEKLGYGLGSFVGNIVGGALAGVSAGLPAIGTNLSNFMIEAKPFIDGIQTIDPTALDGAKSLAAIVLVLSAADFIQGLTSWFSGSSSFDKMASQLKGFGTAIAEFSSEVEGKVNGDAVTNAANAGKAIAELAKALPNEGGVVGFFAGENDIATFGENLALFGKSLADYSQTVAGINTTVIENSMDTARSIMNVQNGMDKDYDLSDFGDSIYTFGDYLNGFYSYIEDIDASQMSNIITQTGRLVSVVREMSGVDTQGMDSFGTALSKIGDIGISNFVNTFDSAHTKVQKAGRDLLDSAASGMRDRQQQIIDLMTRIVTSLVSTINDNDILFEYSGARIMSSFIDGIQLRQVEVVNAVTGAMNQGIMNVRSKYNDSYSAGSYFLDGFRMGISDNEQRAANAARSMAQASVDAARKALDEHSPSKIMYQVGDYAGSPYVRALLSYVSKARDAGKDLGNATTIGLGNAISSVNDMLQGRLETRPTIRPILDLSDVEANAGKITNIFSQPELSYSIAGTVAKAKNIEATINRTSYSGNDDVVSAIKDLKGSIQPSGDTYTIDGITYDDGSNIATLMKNLVRSAKIERRM